MNRIKAAIIRVAYIAIFPIAGAMLHNSHRVRVLVLAEGELLLQRSSVGHQQWSVPGGGVEKNESDEDAAIRETEEEVGIKIRKKDLKKLGWQRVPATKGWPYINVSFFEVQLPKKPIISITRPLEILEANWFPVANMPKKYSKTVDIALSLQE